MDFISSATSRHVHGRLQQLATLSSHLISSHSPTNLWAATDRSLARWIIHRCDYLLNTPRAVQCSAKPREFRRTQNSRQLLSSTINRDC